MIIIIVGFKIKFQTKNHHEENDAFLFSDTGGSEERALSLMFLQGHQQRHCLQSTISPNNLHSLKGALLVQW